MSTSFIQKFLAAREGELKGAVRDDKTASQAVDMAIAVANALGAPLASGSRVLDFGCGMGSTVQELLHRGYDAYGVDVGEWWGKDFDAYWMSEARPPKFVITRLATVNELEYRLPYNDASIDFAMSAQVFEHVFNYVDVFRELGRVLSKDAVSVHIFPGRGCLYEPHLFIPFAAISHWAIWQAIWALFVRRHKTTFREEFSYLNKSMKSNNYPATYQLRRWGREAGVLVTFEPNLYLSLSQSRPRRLLEKSRKLKLGWLAAPFLRLVSQRCMIIRPCPTRSVPR